MKKRLFSFALATVMMLSLCACRSNDNDDTTVTTTTAPTVTTTATEATTTTVATTTTTVPTIAKPVTYTSTNNAGLSLTLPASWDGKYAVRDDAGSVMFYELNNHMYDGSGKLFTVKIMEAAAYDDGMFPSYDFIGEYGDEVVVVLYPSDVQFSATYADAYNAMNADLPSIVATITYNP